MIAIVSPEDPQQRAASLCRVRSENDNKHNNDNDTNNDNNNDNDKKKKKKKKTGVDLLSKPKGVPLCLALSGRYRYHLRWSPLPLPSRNLDLSCAAIVPPKYTTHVTSDIFIHVATTLAVRTPGTLDARSSYYPYSCHYIILHYIILHYVTLHYCHSYGVYSGAMSTSLADHCNKHIILSIYIYIYIYTYV